MPSYIVVVPHDESAVWDVVSFRSNPITDAAAALLAEYQCAWVATLIDCSCWKVECSEEDLVELALKHGIRWQATPAHPAANE